MTVSFVAQIRIEDAAAYQSYLDRCDEVFARFSGTYLAVDAGPTVLEGRWPYSRVVLIAFPTEADLQAWYGSAEYPEILRHRLAGATCDTVVVHGTEREAAPA